VLIGDFDEGKIRLKSKFEFVQISAQRLAHLLLGTDRLELHSIHGHKAAFAINF
jgi:hypothetical protein